MWVFKRVSSGKRKFKISQCIQKLNGSSEACVRTSVIIKLSEDVKKREFIAFSPAK